MVHAHSMHGISVVIPTHNRPQEVREAVQSVYEQTYEGLVEAVVVFDRCPVTDLPSPPPGRMLTVIENTAPRGSSSPRTVGVTYARFDIVAFLDDDDRFVPEKLSRQMQEFVPGGGVLSGVRYVAAGRFHDHLPDPTPDLVTAIVARGAFFPIQTLVVDRDLVLAVGGLDPKLPVSQDVDLLLQLARTANLQVIREPLTEMARSHQARISLRYDDFLSDCRRMLVKHKALVRRHPEALYPRRIRLAWLASAEGRRTEARIHARRALRMRPWSPHSWATVLAVTMLPSSAFGRANQLRWRIMWEPLPQVSEPGGAPVRSLAPQPRTPGLPR
jgi:glycosyltransferase involved in cell wall biosynthesis